MTGQEAAIAGLQSGPFLSPGRITVENRDAAQFIPRAFFP